eukprot:CAMPEP_0176350436 /NCGR_PEP_ID=MMETSP0126-20121128/9467_1 /TAXON_ID=141414 ORGANISM="Strombidinopsis acuminatum, Strain SPMC142" /NCGR_SAMPLE_ID=MMETSP0126 /ASSEMBLY_ACC=CAM_ASM_000229 /LENGTH=42 /DNA_ID= /DNA_START= /DNA_END= /DNA_ORIENTATION=
MQAYEEETNKFFEDEKEFDFEDDEDFDEEIELEIARLINADL